MIFDCGISGGIVMKIARKMRRALEKKAKQGTVLGVHDVIKAKKEVRHVTTREIVARENIRMEAQTNIILMIDVAMMRTFNFGKDRLLRLRKKMFVHLECLRTHYSTVEDLEEIIKQEAGVIFQIDPDCRNWDMVRRTEYEVVRVMSAVFVVALRDEFGFGPKRLDKAYNELASIAHDVQMQKTNLKELREERANHGKKEKKAA